MTDKGLEDIVKHPTRSKSETRKGILHLYELSFNEGLEYLKHNTNLLQTPIVLDDKFVLVGYNSEEIRNIFPKNTEGIIKKSVSKPENIAVTLR